MIQRDSVDKLSDSLLLYRIKFVVC